MKFETNSGIDLPKIIKQMGPGLIGLELGVGMEIMLDFYYRNVLISLNCMV